MNMTTTTRTELAKSLIEGFSHNDWEGSDSVERIAEARYAVVIERDHDSWVLAATDIEAVAGIYRSTFTGTEGYDEWVSEVWDMELGAAVDWSGDVSVTMKIGDEEATAS